MKTYRVYLNDLQEFREACVKKSITCVDIQDIVDTIELATDLDIIDIIDFRDKNPIYKEQVEINIYDDRTCSWDFVDPDKTNIETFKGEIEMLTVIGKIRIFENKSKKNGKYYFTTSLGSKNGEDWHNMNAFVSLDKDLVVNWVDKDGYAYADIDVKASYVNFVTTEKDDKVTINTINIFIYELENEKKKTNRRR